MIKGAYYCCIILHAAIGPGMKVPISLRHHATNFLPRSSFSFNIKQKKSRAIITLNASTIFGLFRRLIMVRYILG
jgi:hypothetical protein